MNNWHLPFNEDSFSDSRTMIRFNAFIRVFSRGIFHVHTLFMCFLSFTGLTLLYLTFKPFLKQKEKLLGLAIFFIPSVVFWTSGVLKEGLLILGMGGLLYSSFRLIDNKFSLKTVLAFLLSIGLLLILKVYILLLLIPALISFAIAKQFKKTPALATYGVVYGLFLLGAIALSAKIDIPKELAKKQRNFVSLSKGGVFMRSMDNIVYIPDSSRHLLNKVDKKHYVIKTGSDYCRWNIYHSKDTTWVKNSEEDTTSYLVRFDNPVSGSKIQLRKLSPTWLGILKNIPNAVSTSLFRPLLFIDNNGALLLVSALENSALILLLLIAIFFRNPLTKKQTNLFLLSLFFTLSLYTLAGLTTPVLGALVRYKVPALPFYVVTLLLFLDTERLTKYFKR